MKISIKVKPNSKERRVEQTGYHQFLIKVKAPAQENKANKEAIEALADHLHVPKSRISIVSGSKSRQKVVNIEEDK